MCVLFAKYVSVAQSNGEYKILHINVNDVLYLVIYSYTAIGKVLCITGESCTHRQLMPKLLVLRVGLKLLVYSTCGEGRGGLRGGGWKTNRGREGWVHPPSPSG